MTGKNILVGITGSIAAYKTATLIRLLVKEGANVKVVMTPVAKEFITPLTLATLSKNPIMVDFYNPENGDWNSHVAAGIWADLMLIAPASANTIGKMAHGIADNLLLTTYLSAKNQVMIAPAMDLDMYKHPATQENLKKLEAWGNIILEPAEGELASGLAGKGRMLEPEEIAVCIKQFFREKGDLKGRKVLLTSGPTYEKIDKVRFIGNFSSGKMGLALARELTGRGAEVVMVSGPVSPDKIPSGIKIVRVVSAEEMYREVIKYSGEFDIIISCAAVADFTPVRSEAGKIKRGKENMQLDLKPTKDIAAELGKRKKKGQLLVGFALEAEDEFENAQRKLEKKNLDMIVLNSLNDSGAGFGVDTNKVTIISANGGRKEFGIKAKEEVAKDIINEIIREIEKRR